MALCRCGQSRNKPFCDNSHREARFHAPGAIAGAAATANGAATASATADANTNATESAEAEAADALNPLSIVATPNGPLALEGVFTLHTADGSVHQTP